MHKILIEVYVPELETQYDIMIPIAKTIKVTIVSIEKMIHDLSDGVFPITGKKRLHNYLNGEMLALDFTVRQANLKNGSKVIFI